VTPPKDPVLRAIHFVGQAKDLTPTEKYVLLALWRFLGSEAKPIGPSLVAHLTGTKPSHAKKVLHGLLIKGYITSSGKWASGLQRTATRQLTDKIKWPKRYPRSNQGRSPERSPRSNRKAEDRYPGSNQGTSIQERSPGGNHRYPGGNSDRYPGGSTDLIVGQRTTACCPTDGGRRGGDKESVPPTKVTHRHTRKPEDTGLTPIAKILGIDGDDEDDGNDDPDGGDG
jgi:hypothetical protein